MAEFVDEFGDGDELAEDGVGEQVGAFFIGEGEVLAAEIGEDGGDVFVLGGNDGNFGTGNTLVNQLADLPGDPVVFVAGGGKFVAGEGGKGGGYGVGGGGGRLGGGRGFGLGGGRLFGAPEVRHGAEDLVDLVLLGEAFVQLVGELVGEVQNGTGAAVVVGEGDDVGVVIIAKINQVGGVGALEGEDGLVVVAHRHDLGLVVVGEQLNQLKLGGVGVLKLV